MDMRRLCPSMKIKCSLAHPRALEMILSAGKGGLQGGGVGVAFEILNDKGVWR
jgi:hypothetical protein